MRTVTLQSILLRAWQRAGNDASSISNISSGTLTMLVAAANERIADAWEWADWPELMRVEERTVQGNETTGFYIDSDQGGSTTPMGEVFNIYRDNPNTHVAPREIQYTLLEDSIRFPQGTDLPTTVWVRFRLRPAEYEYNPSNPAKNLSSATDTQVVPNVIAKAIGLGLTADLFDEDGQSDRAVLMEQKAENELIIMRDKFYFQQNQPSSWTARINYI